jgi:hypothetical protein
MRNAINKNPIAQIAVVGVLVLVVGMLLFGGVMKKDSPPPPVPAAPGTTVAPGTPGAPVTTAPPAPGTTDPAAVAATPTDPTAVGAAPATTSGALPVVPGPPLPPRVQAAYRDGKVVVLLVHRGGGIDDKMVAQTVTRLHSVPGVAVFTSLARGIARYTRITQGVNVDRVPALVVVRPRDLTAGTPTAEVRYGFTSPASVVQQVRDALYNGPTVGYSPD